MANKTFTSISELLNYIESNMVINLEKIGEEVKSYLRTTILTDWYRDHQPTYYERSNMLIDSLTVTKAKKIGNGYEVKIFFDPDKITPTPPGQEGWFPGHSNITDGASSYNGMSYGELLPIWIEQGQNSSINPFSGIGMVEKTKNDLLRGDRYLLERMKELLELKGFKIV